MHRLPSRIQYRYFWGVFNVFLSLTWLLFGSASAVASPAAISQGFSSDSAIHAGMLVSISKDDNNKVVSSDLSNQNSLAGVVVNKDESNINFLPPNSSVLVGTSGIYYVHVSTMNGDISRNDRITASPIAGYGMRATQAGRILGTAQADFNSKSDKVTKSTIKDSKGKQIDVYSGDIPVNIAIENWSGPNIASSSTNFLTPAQNFLSTLVGKKVSQTKAVLTFLILLVSLLMSFIIVFTSVSSGFDSIGRNPLARKSITGNVLFVIILVMVLLGGSFLAIVTMLLH